MSNALLARPLRPLSASFGASLRCSAAAATGSTTTAAAPATTTSKPSTPSASTTPHPSYTQCRHESTARRQTNRLRSVPASPSFTPSSSSSQGGGVADHIVFNPPSSAPSVYHTPLKFLPAGDRRRELAAITSRMSGTASNKTTSRIAATGTPLSSPSTHAANLPPHLSGATALDRAAPLPPPVRQPYAKKYHLTEADIAEIRQLRAQDPATWTRERLAARFECSQFFVGLVAPAPEHAARKQAEADEVKRGWGRRKRDAREDRRRRRELWGRDA